MTMTNESNERIWSKFHADHGLTPEQTEQFKTYFKTLIHANEQINLTAITSLKKVLSDHFADSMVLKDFADLSGITSMADVGAGAGFPAIPLKILFPHIRMVLIEVTYKKRKFLQHLVEQLGLEDIEICELDWRTFLRVTEGEIDMFVSRAALDEVELARLFRHNCSYRTGTMVYWASEQWEPHKKAQRYIDKVETYQISSKTRKLVFMKANDEQVD